MTGTGMTEPILKVSELAFSYSSDRPVLQGVNIEIDAGERVGIIGPNGAGKTTFFLVACGVLKACGGTIQLAGVPVSPGQCNADMGLVFQNPDDQLFCPTVGDDVAFGPRNLGLAPEDVTARVQEALFITGIVDLADRSVYQLSEGEKRLAAIAGVLAMKPRIVLYDEPSANLDIRFRRRLISFLQRSTGAMMIASHDLELVLEVCHRVILMDEGRVIADGISREIMMNEKLMEAHGQERPHSLVPHGAPHRHGSGLPGGG